MHVVARARLVLVRRPWIYWLVVVALSTLVAVTVHGQLSALDDARAEWGSTRRVHVALRQLDPGGPIDTRRVELPIALLPTGAITERPPDAVLRQRVAEGEVLTELDIAVRPGPAARAPEGTVVVAITDPLARVAPIGAPVRVAAEGLVVAESASIVDIVDDVVFVAVAPRDAPAVAGAAQRGLATLMYLP